MKFPDSVLYLPTSKDIASGEVLAQRYSNIAAVSTAAVTVSIRLPVADLPFDRVLVCTGIEADGEPGGAQLTNFVTLTVVDRLTGGQLWRLKRVEGEASGRGQIDYIGEVVIFPGERVQAEFSFNGGVAANTIRLSVHGYLIPKGNFQIASF